MDDDTRSADLVPGGSALGRLLYPEPAERRAGAIVGWWERRRLPFNLIVAGAGLVSLGVVNLVVALPPFGELAGVPWFPILLYGLLANVCYSLGPAVEIGIEKLWRGKVLPSGPLLFRAGLTFAVGLTLLPIILVTIGYLLRILGAIA